jgi:hypothetical protein
MPLRNFRTDFYLTALIIDYSERFEYYTSRPEDAQDHSHWASVEEARERVNNVAAGRAMLKTEGLDCCPEMNPFFYP